jgi:hypothetical protein
MTQQLLDSEEIVTELDISHLVIEDDTPVDNFQSAKQQRLLVEPLYASWSPEYLLLPTLTSDCSTPSSKIPRT